MTAAEEAKQWAGNADGDFELLEAGLNAGVDRWNLLCFHAQQGAEKYLKALLILHSVAPPPHNLAQLLEAAAAFDTSLSSLMTECNLLTPYGVAQRYSMQQPDEAAARQAIAAGYRVLEAIRKMLP